MGQLLYASTSTEPCHILFCKTHVANICPSNEFTELQSLEVEGAELSLSFEGTATDSCCSKETHARPKHQTNGVGQESACPALGPSVSSKTRARPVKSSQGKAMSNTNTFNLRRERYASEKHENKEEQTHEKICQVSVGETRITPSNRNGHLGSRPAALRCIVNCEAKPLQTLSTNH